MRKIFESCEHEKVGHFQSILASNEIKAFIKNDSIVAADGCAPLDLVLPELWVLNDSDYDWALEILTPYYK